MELLLERLEANPSVTGCPWGKAGSSKGSAQTADLVRGRRRQRFRPSRSSLASAAERLALPAGLPERPGAPLRGSAPDQAWELFAAQGTVRGAAAGLAITFNWSGVHRPSALRALESLDPVAFLDQLAGVSP